MLYVEVAFLHQEAHQRLADGGQDVIGTRLLVTLLNLGLALTRPIRLFCNSCSDHKTWQCTLKGIEDGSVEVKVWDRLNLNLPRVVPHTPIG